MSEHDTLTRGSYSQSERQVFAKTALTAAFILMVLLDIVLFFMQEKPDNFVVLAVLVPILFSVVLAYQKQVSLAVWLFGLSFWGGLAFLTFNNPQSYMEVLTLVGRIIFPVVLFIPIAWFSIENQMEKIAAVFVSIAVAITVALSGHAMDASIGTAANSDLLIIINIIIGVVVVGVIWLVVQNFALFGKWFSNLSLRYKLTAFVFLLIIPTVLTISLRTANQAAEQIEADEQRLLADSYKGLFGTTTLWLEENASFLTAVSEIPAIISMEESQQKPILEAFDRNNPHVFLVNTTNTKGINVARNDDEAPKDYSDREWFLGPMSGEELTFQSLISRTIGEPALAMSVPIKDGSRTVGVLQIALKFSELTEAVSAVEVGETGVSYIVDANNTLIAHTDTSYFELEELVDFSGDPAVQAIRDGYTGILHYTDLNNEQRMAYVGVDEENGWGIVVSIDEHEVQAPSVRMRNQSYLTLAVVLVPALLLVWVILGNTVKPITQLTKVTQHYSAGDFSARAEVRSDDEIGQLARAFNQMAQEVGEQTVALAERAREMEASQRVTFAASERTTPDDFLDLLVNLIVDQFDIYHAQVYLVDADRTKAVLSQSTGYAGRQLLQRGHNIPLERESLVTRCINTGEPVLVGNTVETEGWLANPLLPYTQSELVVPLKIDDTVIGALDIQSREPDRFTDETVPVFASMTEQVAFLYQNNELLIEIENRTLAQEKIASQLQAGTEVANQLSTILDPEQLLDQAVVLLQGRFNLYHAHVYLLDEAKENLVVEAGSGQVGIVLKRRKHSIPLNAEKSIVARAARTRTSVLVGNTTEIEEWMPNPLLPDTKSELALPLVARGELLGVLDLQDEVAGRFTNVDASALGTLAGQIATAIENAQLFVYQRQQEQRFMTVADYTYDWETWQDENGQYVYVSPACERITGYARDEFIETPGLFKQIIHPDDIAHYEEHESLHFHHDDIEAVEFRIVCKDGSVAWMGHACNPVFDDEGNFRGRRGSNRDITEEHAARQATAARLAVTQALAGDPTEDQILDALVKETEIYPDARVTLYYEDLNSEVRTLVIQRDEAHESGLTPLGEGYRLEDSVLPFGDVLPRDGNFVTGDVSGDTRLADATKEVMLGVGYKSLATFPMKMSNDWVAYLFVTSPKEDFFTEENLRLYSIVAEEGTDALVQARLRAAIATSAERDRVRFEIAEALAGDLTVDEVWDVLQERALNGNVSIVFSKAEGLPDGDKLLTIVRAKSNTPELTPAPMGYTLKFSENPAFIERVGIGEFSVINDIHTDPSMQADPQFYEDVKVQGVNSIMSAWLGDSKESVIGFMAVQSPELDFFDEETTSMYQSLVELGTVALRSALLREQTEEERARFEALVTYAPDAILLLNYETFMWMDANKNAEAMFGMSREELLKTGPAAVSPEYQPDGRETGEKAVALISDAVAGGNQQFEWVHKDVNGREFDCEIRLALLPGDDKVLLVNITDITERKAAQEAIQESQGRLSRLVEQSPIAVIEWNTDFEVVSWNPAAEQIFGYSEVEAMGKHAAGLIVPEEVRPIVNEIWGNLMEKRGGETSTNENFTKDGRKITCDWFNTVLVGADDEVLGVTSMVMDVTERKQAQQAIVQGDRLKSEFLANMSHELRTPLNSILGYTDVLLMGLDGDLEDDVRVDLEAIHENSQHLLRLINDILDLAKIEAGRMTFSLGEVNVPQVLEELRRNNAGLLVGKDVDLVIDASEDLSTIVADERRVYQVINNLVSNAAKFTEKGSITMRAFEEGDHMVLQVEDTGMGIDQENLDAIFEEFTQVDTSSTRQHEGTGLGLTITRRLVHMHGGTIGVESEAGKGSTFTVRLPKEAKVDPDLLSMIVSSSSANGQGGPETKAEAETEKE